MAELRSFGEEIHFREGVPPADPEPLDVPASVVAPQRESKGLDTDEEENRVGHRIVIGSFPDFLSDVEPRTRRPGARPSGRPRLLRRGPFSLLSKLVRRQGIEPRTQ